MYDSKIIYTIPIIICLIIIITFGYLPQISALAKELVYNTSQGQMEYLAGKSDATIPCSNIYEIMKFKVNILTDCEK